MLSDKEICETIGCENFGDCEGHEHSRCGIFNDCHMIAVSQEKDTCKEIAAWLHEPCAHLTFQQTYQPHKDCYRCCNSMLKALANGEMPKEEHAGQIAYG